MKVLVINSGSSSLKYQLIDMETEGVIAKGTCERIGIEGSKLTHKAKGLEKVIEQPMPDHTVAVSLVFLQGVNEVFPLVNEAVANIIIFFGRLRHSVKSGINRQNSADSFTVLHNMPPFYSFHFILPHYFYFVKRLYKKVLNIF